MYSSFHPQSCRLYRFCSTFDEVYCTYGDIFQSAPMMDVIGRALHSLKSAIVPKKVTISTYRSEIHYKMRLVTF